MPENNDTIQEKDIVRLKDKVFRLSFSEEFILTAVQCVADRMNQELRNKNPLFLGMLNGAFIYAADLMRRITIPAEISFVKFASYSGTSSTGCTEQLIGLRENLNGRTVVVVEDIVDSGYTMQQFTKYLHAHGVGEIYISTLLHKPHATKYPVRLDYVAMEIPNDFIVGYGLDYEGYGRNLRGIYTLVE